MLVGRDDQLARLTSALSDDQPVVVVGESGVGKTTLLRAAAAATGRRLYEGGALSTLSWLEYLAIERALGHGVGTGDPELVASEVEAAVGDGVLLLDDLQWAGAGTVACVELLAGRVGLLVGVRRGDASAEGVIDRLRAAGFEVVELRGLEQAAAQQLVTTVRPDLGSAGVARLVARAGGNPLLLRELAATGEPSASLRLALAARLRRLDDVGRDAFGILALAGRPVSVEHLGRAGAKSLLDAELAVPIDPGHIEIRHTLLGEVAISEMDENEQRRLHAIIAREVDDDGEAARHHALAGESELAYAAAMRAAANATRPGERASHLAVAAACATGREADALRLEAARALEDAHDWPALSALLAELRSGDADVRANAALLRARGAWRAGDPDGLRAALSEGLELVGGTGTDTEVRLRIEASRIPIFIDNDPLAAVRSTTEALELAIAADVDVPRAQYLHGTALYIAQDTSGAEFLSRAVATARETGDVGTEMVAANNLIAFHESMGDPALGRDVAVEFIARAHDLGLGVWERSFRMALSNLDFHAGNYHAVLAAADELLDLPLEMRTREALVEQHCLALIDIGRIDEAVRRVRALPARPDDWWWRRQVGWVLTEAALWGGQPQRAIQHADDILTGPEGDLNLAFAHVSRAWALFDLGRDPGPPISQNFPAMLAAVPHEVDGITALHRGEFDRAVAAFDQAAQAWSLYHRRGELRALWAAGEAARRGGAPDAVERLLEAERRAQQHEMLPLLGRIHRSLRAAGIRRAAPRKRSATSPLTEREQHVLRLVADGLTNAQIAARLSVSRHTVVSQIASASAKLGATSRTHAASLADLLEPTG